MSDGASVNRTTLREFEKLLTDSDGNWSAAEHDILYVLVIFMAKR